MSPRAALAAVCLRPHSLPLASPKTRRRGPSASRWPTRRRSFLRRSTTTDRDLATMDFDDPRRLDWHNIPKPERKGLQLRDMSPEQQELCHALLRSALSETGYETAVRILALENNLHEGEKNLTGGQLRDPAAILPHDLRRAGCSGRVGLELRGPPLLAQLRHPRRRGRQRHAQLLGRQPGDGEDVRRRRARSRRPHAGRGGAAGVRPARRRSTTPSASAR